MTTAKYGDTVRVHYTAKLEDGSYIYTSRKRQPLEAVISEKGVLAGFTSSIVGMKAGEKKTAKLPPEKAAGSKREEFIFNINKSRLSKKLNLLSETT